MCQLGRRMDHLETSPANKTETYKLKSKFNFRKNVFKEMVLIGYVYILTQAVVRIYLNIYITFQIVMTTMEQLIF